MIKGPADTGLDTYFSNFHPKDSFPVVVDICQILKLLQLVLDLPCFFGQIMSLVSVHGDRKTIYNQLEEKRQA